MSRRFVPRLNEQQFLRLNPQAQQSYLAEEQERKRQMQIQDANFPSVFNLGLQDASRKRQESERNAISDANVAGAIQELTPILSELASTKQQIKQSKLDQAKLASESRAQVAPDPVTKNYIPIQSTNALAQVAAEKLNSIKIDIENLLVREKQLNDAAEALKTTEALNGFRFTPGGYFTNYGRRVGTPAVTLPTLPTLATTNTMPKSSIYEQRVRQLQQQGVSPADIDRLFRQP